MAGPPSEKFLFDPLYVKPYRPPENVFGTGGWIPKPGDDFIRRPRNDKKDTVAAMTLWRCKGVAGFFVVAVPALGGVYSGRTLMSADDFVFQPAEGVYELLTGTD